MKNPKLIAIQELKKDMMDMSSKRYAKPKKEEKIEDSESPMDGKPSLIIRIERLKGKK